MTQLFIQSSGRWGINLLGASHILGLVYRLVAFNAKSVTNESAGVCCYDSKRWRCLHCAFSVRITHFTVRF
jgi:hypothetical protein